MTEYKLTYFDIKGLAEPIRILLHLAKVPFEDVRIPYTPGQPPVIPPEIKQKLPFGQVPILEIDGEVLSQSGAILRFIARKYNLMGSSDLEAARIDEINDALKDYADAWRAVFMAKDDEAKAAGLKNALEVATPKYLEKFSHIVESNGSGFLVGKSVTLADVTLSHFLSYIGPIYEVDLVKDYPSLQAHIKLVNDIPEIKEYIEKRPKSLR